MSGETTPKSASVAAADSLGVPWSAARLERNLSKVKARVARRALAAKAGVAVSVLASAAALLVWYGQLGAPAPAPPAEVSAIATSSASPKTTFVDGSVARVSSGGELVVSLATPLRIESTLLSGAADFEVSKRPERDFLVVAGSVQVRVVGTRFRVERLGERTHVSVSEGKVEVREAQASTSLEAGESRFFPSTAPPVEEEPRSAQPPSPRARFLELARGGDYKAAYQVLSRSPSVVGSSAEDLMLAADAARLSNHPAQAVDYLRRVTTEHAGDSRAPLSAFTLGRVLLSQLGRPAEAAEAFALARRLKPAGSLAEDALAREAEARAASGSPGKAAALAREYLSRYPRGKHGSTMQRLVNQP